ncbi:MAG: crosslink repair DNA glycosylase YcaQ family protein [Thiolinea sp.]
MTISLSPDQARKLVLHSQRLPPPTVRAGSATAATLDALEHLGYIQIDTISVVERAHHHTLWNRNPRYQPQQLEQLLADKNAYEYWAHAAAYLPMRDFRYSLPRKHAIKSGAQNHWYERDTRLMNYVLDRIRAEGPLLARDFEHTGPKLAEWRSKPAKRALEYLFMQGDLMTPYRQNFHKVYDLTERVLPPETDTRLPTAEEHARFLILRFLEANGLGQPADFSYLLDTRLKQAIRRYLPALQEDGAILPVQVGQQSWYILPDSLALLDQPLARRKAKILSPYDNLLIQRQRMRSLFDFDYLLECYVPAAKRRYGYFCLPVLWDGRLIARMDCKADRKRRVLQILSLHVENPLKKTGLFREHLTQELQAFMRFNDCERLENYSGFTLGNTHI